MKTFVNGMDLHNMMQQAGVEDGICHIHIKKLEDGSYPDPFTWNLWIA